MFKGKVVSEYLTTDISQKELMIKYGILGKNTVSRWLKAHEQRNLALIQHKNPTLDGMKSKNEAADHKKLIQRIDELEKALQDSELKAIAYQKLVENAEKELGIRLPKKSSTKRSRS